MRTEQIIEDNKLKWFHTFKAKRQEVSSHKKLLSTIVHRILMTSDYLRT